MFWGTMAVTAAIGGGLVFLLLVLIDALFIAGSTLRPDNAIRSLFLGRSPESTSALPVPPMVPLILVGAGALAGALFTVRHWPARWEEEARERAAREYRPHPVFAAALREQEIYREAMREKKRAKANRGRGGKP